MEKNLVVEKNIINSVKLFLKEISFMKEKMEKEQNTIRKVYYYLKENIYMVKNGMEKVMINQEI